MQMMKHRCKIVLLLLVTAFLATPANAQVVGGMPTTIKEHPWLVALYVKNKQGRRLCGGTIIKDGWVLTAAHCFTDAGANPKTRVKTGATRLMTPGVEVDAHQIILHPNYNATTNANDVALLRVAGIKRTSIRLPNKNETLPPYEMVIVTGWGLTSSGQMADELQEAWVPHVPIPECNTPRAYNGAIADTMLCAGHPGGGSDACAGDSGGPLVWRKSDAPVLVGIVSFGEGCGQAQKPGVYTRVRNYLDWIETTTAQKINQQQ